MHLTTPLYGILALGAACSAQAAFVATLSQVGNDVVLTGSGTLNISDLTSFPSTVSGSLIMSGYGVFLSGNPIGHDYLAYSSPDMTGPVTLGGLDYDGVTGIGTGAYFGAQGEPLGYLIIVPDNYVSGTVIVGGTVFENTTLADLGVAVGSYVWTWGQGANADSLTLNVLAVPEPAHYAIGAGLVALALVALRRRVK